MNLVWTQQSSTPLSTSPPSTSLLSSSPASDETTGENTSGEKTIHLLEINDTSDESLKLVIEECIDKSISLLENNIKDNSCYMLFEWNKNTSTLNIVITDDKKEDDSNQVVRCCFKTLNLKPNDYTDKIHYWIRDYLTTCPGFMNYSLVATFHSENRQNCTLL